MSNTIESKGGKSAISSLFALPVSMCFLKWTALMEYGKYKKLVTSITVSCCLCIINYMPCNKAVGEIPFHLKSFIVWMVVMITKQVTLSLLAILFINIFLTKGKLLQSGGSDSTVNLWFASTTASDELTSERSFFLICLPDA
jgi:hypothetical protein